jgi:cation transport ATPase
MDPASNSCSTNGETPRGVSPLPLIRDLLTLASLTILGIVIFVALFWVGFLKQSSPILMYRGISIAIAAAALQVVLLSNIWRASRYHSSAKSPLITAATALAFAFNIAFLIVVPVTVDRSVTVFLLGQISRAPNGISAAELRQALVNKYIDQYDAVDRRMREQSLSGNVEAKGELYKLTTQGTRFIKFSRLVGSIFGADLRYLTAESAENKTSGPN